MKIPAPNFTQTPNELFDRWLPLLKEVELKVLLVIMRKTFGWHRTRDRISISQLETLTGSTQSNVIAATKTLSEKGLIKKEVVGAIGKQVTYYDLVVTEDSNNSYPSQIDRGPLPNQEGGTPPKLGDTKERDILNKQQQKKGQAAPAVAVSFSVEKGEGKIPPKNQSIPPCLEKISIPQEDKIHISCTQEWATIEDAIGWACHPSNPPKKSLTASIIYACKKKLSSRDFEVKPKKTPLEILSCHFKNGDTYNDAECTLNKEGISFVRGMKNAYVKFDQYFNWEALENLCKKFQINPPRYA